MEYNAPCLIGLQLQNFSKVPGYRLSFTVLIGSKPYRIRFIHKGLQFLYQLLLFRGHYILRLKILLNVNSVIFLGQIKNMAVTRLNYEIFTNKFFNFLSIRL